MCHFKQIYFLLLLCLLNCRIGKSQEIDSLKRALTNAKHDSTKLRILVLLSERCELNDVLKYAELALDLAEKLLRNKSSDFDLVKFYKAGATNNIGYINEQRGQITTALECYEKSLKIYEEIGSKDGYATLLNNIGYIYQQQADIPKALDYHSRSLKIREEIGDKQGIAASFNNLGLIYNDIDDYATALIYYTKCLKMMEKLGDKEGIATSLNNIGCVYLSQRNYPKALTYCQKSLEIRTEIGDKLNAGTSLNCLGLINFKLDSIPNALNYYAKSLKLYREVNYKLGIASCLDNIGTVYLKLGTHLSKKGNGKILSLAKAYSDSSLVLSNELGYPESIRRAHQTLAKIDSASGNYAGAFHHYKQFILFRDSLNNEQTRKASYRSQLKYDFEKKELLLKEEQEKDRAVAEQKSRFQLIIIWVAVGGMLLIIIFSIFIYRSLQQNKRINALIEEKQREILDSIHYAKKIQTALIPSEKYFDKELRRLKEKNS